MVKNEKGFSLVELAVAAAAAVTIGAIAVTVSTGTSAAISSKARAGKTTADSYNSSVVYSPDVAIGTSLVNLLTNGGFEAGTGNTGGWQAVPGPAPTVTTAQAHSGVWSGVPSYDGNGNGYNMSVGFSGTVGSFYSFSGWVRSSTATSITITSQLGTSITPMVISVPANTWTYWKLENKQIPTGAIGNAIYIENANSSFWVDDVSVVAGPVAP